MHRCLPAALVVCLGAFGLPADVAAGPFTVTEFAEVYGTAAPWLFIGTGSPNDGTTPEGVTNKGVGHAVDISNFEIGANKAPVPANGTGSGDSYNPGLEWGGNIPYVPGVTIEGQGTGIDGFGFGGQLPLGQIIDYSGNVAITHLEDGNNGTIIIRNSGQVGTSNVGVFAKNVSDGGAINSDLKNTYGVVRVPINGREVDTGETFVGMLVGDHSKLGINVSSPTGAVVGFCSSVFAAQSPKFVPSFAWIDHEKVVRYGEQRGLQLARRVMARRQREMTPAEERLFLSVRKQALAIEVQQQWEIERAASRGPSDNPGGSTSPSGET